MVTVRRCDEFVRLLGSKPETGPQQEAVPTKLPASDLEQRTSIRWEILPELTTIVAIFLRLYLGVMARDTVHDKAHEQSYLMSELESLGLTTVRLNEFNDNEELGSLVKIIKEEFLAEYREGSTFRS